MTQSPMVTHEPVMAAEVVTVLDPARGGLFVDCTVGGGGHARALLEGGADRVLGLDRDGEALAAAARTLTSWTDRVELVHSDFRNLDAALAERGIGDIDGGALADLGISSLQLDGAGRGFSFRRDEPLDMRMDRSTGPTAADLLRDTPESELADVIHQYGEDRYARRISRRLVASRVRAPLTSTGQLAEAVRPCGALPGPPAHPSRHPHLPGAANLGQPRARRAGRLAAGALPAPADRGAAGRHHLSFAGGSHRQAGVAPIPSVKPAPPSGC